MLPEAASESAKVVDITALLAVKEPNGFFRQIYAALEPIKEKLDVNGLYLGNLIHDRRLRDKESDLVRCSTAYGKASLDVSLSWFGASGRLAEVLESHARTPQQLRWAAEEHSPLIDQALVAVRRHAALLPNSALADYSGLDEATKKELAQMRSELEQQFPGLEQALAILDLSRLKLEYDK